MRPLNVRKVTIKEKGVKKAVKEEMKPRRSPPQLPLPWSFPSAHAPFPLRRPFANVGPSHAP
jgi:hypothetical protein